ncbi:AAA family ATPase [Ralstonia sp. L16]|uniref:AAA family ATPase n=1 Tax=Ralstonia sp. L16 TaxID=3423950 RepID=UPI003F791AC3
MLTRQFVSHVTLRRDTVAAFDAYPFSLPAVCALDTLELHPKVTFLVGENGSGKSTLMEAIAVALGFNAEGGSRNFNFSTHASHSELHAHLRIARGFRKPRTEFFLRAESFFNVATNIQQMDDEPGLGGRVIDSYGGRSLHAQSHGESFLALLMNRFGPNGLYLLDEPEAALSPQRQLAVLTRLHDLVQAESQFVIATHSPILMAYPDAWIYQCDGDGIRRVAYEETEHFQVTRDFLANPQRMLNMLLEQ